MGKFTDEMDDDYEPASTRKTAWYEQSGSWEQDCKAMEARIAQLDAMLTDMSAENMRLAGQVTAVRRAYLDYQRARVGATENEDVVDLAVAHDVLLRDIEAAINEVYPGVAGRTVRLEHDGETVAVATWYEYPRVQRRKKPAAYLAQPKEESNG